MPDRKPTIAIIAPGNMGAAIAARLTEHGVRVVTSLDGRSAASAKRAAAAGMIHVSESEIAAADFVLSIVPPAEAKPIAERLKPALRAANRKPVYVDCNAVSPETVKGIAATVAETGSPFADGGIIGGPPRAGYNGPSIYVSGPDSGRVEILNEHGLRLRGMGGAIGDASALKMSYAGLTKGLIALGTAMVLAAERHGVGEALRAELAESQAAMLAQLTRGVPDMFGKAYRWVAELEEIAKYAGPGSQSDIYRGIAALYERVAEDFEGQKAEVNRLAGFFEKAASAKK